MKQIFIILTVLLSFTASAQQSYETVDVDGENREYYKYLPTSFDSATESVPLVIILHGIGGTALGLTPGQFNQVADTARFIPVYLQGKLNAYNQTSWNNGTLLASSANDILFISSLIDSMKTNHNIDLSRVYMTGISMGSIMTYKTIRHLNDRIAAVSCHIGTMSSQEITDYNPINKIPVQHVHGTDDPTVPYDSGALPSLSLVPATIDKLKAINGWVVDDSTIIDIPDTKADGITIEKIVYNCTTPLELWKMNGGEHIYLLPATNDTSGVIITWNFFRQFTHPNPSTASINTNSQLEPIEFYPNPASTQLFIQKFHTLTEIKITNITGQDVLMLTTFNETIDISNLAPGVYVIQFTTKNGLINSDKLIVK